MMTTAPLLIAAAALLAAAALAAAWAAARAEANRWRLRFLGEQARSASLRAAANHSAGEVWRLRGVVAEQSQRLHQAEKRAAHGA